MTEQKNKNKPLNKTNLDHFKYEVAQEMGLSQRKISKNKSADTKQDTK